MNTRGYGNKSDGIYGIYSYAQNTSTGTVTAGYFYTSSLGTGTHYGIRAYGYGNSTTYGTYSSVYNYSDDEAYAGYFYTSSSGTGKHYGVRANSNGASDSVTYGHYGYASNSSTGDAYGGYFATSSSGTGNHYGLRAEGHGAGGFTSYTYGIYGLGENASSGPAWGGIFIVPATGTGTHLGISATAEGSSNYAATGVYGQAQCTSSGTVYGGAFYAWGGGTGTTYGVQAYAPTAQGYAGYFLGHMTATGTKSAAVKVDNGEYRMLYSQESPENWFEDFGKGALIGGKAVIQIDPLFAQTVNTSVEYHVFPVSEGDCKGLYITNKTSVSFEVREMQGGTSDVPFSYRLVAKRKGYENVRLAKMMGQTPEEMQADQTNRQAEMEKERVRMGHERPEIEKEQEMMRENK